MIAACLAGCIMAGAYYFAALEYDRRADEDNN